MILKFMLFYLKMNKSETMIIIENKNKTNKQTNKKYRQTMFEWVLNKPLSEVYLSISKFLILFVFWSRDHLLVVDSLFGLLRGIIKLW